MRKEDVDSYLAEKREREKQINRGSTHLERDGGTPRKDKTQSARKEELSPSTHLGKDGGKAPKIRKNRGSTHPQDEGNPNDESTHLSEDEGNYQGNFSSESYSQDESYSGDESRSEYSIEQLLDKSSSAKMNYMAIKEQITLEPLCKENVTLTGQMVAN